MLDLFKRVNLSSLIVLFELRGEQVQISGISQHPLWWWWWREGEGEGEGEREDEDKHSIRRISDYEQSTVHITKNFRDKKLSRNVT